MDAPEAAFEVACGIVEVNLVASLTDRGPTLEAMFAVQEQGLSVGRN